MNSPLTHEQKHFTSDEHADLIRAVSELNREAFHQLYKVTHEQVYSYLFRFMLDKDLVEDILAETYIEVWKNAKKFKYRSKVSTWIIGISRNLAMNNINRTKQYETLKDEHIPVVEDNYCEHDIKIVLAKALKKLPEKHREILGLILLPEFSYQQISEILEIPVNTVKSRIFYAKDALKRTLISMGVDYETI